MGTMTVTAPGEVDIAAVARLVGEPARAAMLTLLLDGRAHPAGALADAAGIGRPTATAHLQQLVAAGLVRVQAQGRHRYHRLAGPEVAHAVEALAAIAPRVPVRGLTPVGAARRLAYARTCYDHLAGRVGVLVRDALIEHRYLEASGPGPYDGRRDFVVTGVGAGRLREIGVDADLLTRSRRILARDCLDWTERTPHLAGALPAALLVAAAERGWLVRAAGRRVGVPSSGWDALRGWLGCDPSCHPAPAVTP